MSLIPAERGYQGFVLYLLGAGKIPVAYVCAGGGYCGSWDEYKG